MNIHPRMLALLLVALTAACSTTKPLPPLGGLDYIPLPLGLTYQPDETVVIESPNAQAARLVYRGRIQPDSLRVATRTILEAHGWRHVSTGSAAGHSSIQTFEKDGGSVQLDIYEGLWFTYLSVDASRALLSARPTSSEPLVPETASVSQDEEASEAARAAALSGQKSVWQRTRDRIRAAWNQLFSD
jgi:hypothetical protein